MNKEEINKLFKDNPIKTIKCGDIEVPVEYLKQTAVTINGDDYIKLQQENKQLKHIIDELEKWLEEKLKEMQFIIDDVDIAFEVDYERINEAKNYKVAYNTALNKLQELKGSDKE